MGRFSYYKGMGITNHDTEDYGVLASAHKPHEPIEYMHFCSSHKCTLYQTLRKFKDKEGNTIERVCNVNKSKVLKFVSKKKVERCEDCGNYLEVK